MYEQAIISILLNEPQLFEEVKDTLQPEDFSNETFQKIYSFIQDSDEIDFVKIAQHFDPAYVAELTQTVGVSDSSYLFKYIAKIKTSNKSYQFTKKMSEYVSELKESPEKLPVILDNIEAEISKIPLSNSSFVSSMKSNIYKAVNDLEKLQKRDMIGFKTGIKAIDEMFLGIQPGLYVVAGRPHMGKTTFSLRLADQLASCGAKILFAPLEDGSSQMTKMLVAMRMGISFKDLLHGNYNVDEFYELSSELIDLPLTFTKARFDANSLRRYVKQNRNKIDVLFIDQINHVELEKGFDKRWALNETIRKIKQIVVDFELPIFLLSQLNREVEKREDKRPRLPDLKETGSLEEDADVVFLLYRDGYYNVNSNANVLEVIIPKNKKTYDTGKLILADEGKNIRCGKPA